MKILSCNNNTYWDSHAALALHAMRNGIYPGIDVPAAFPLKISGNCRNMEKIGFHA